ncbi:nicotinic acid mononucleotide adenyltransferase [Psychroserpens sp.]|uniref:nicotinic acid mononucleotide adenyltransferase n=1 Tax=Psychroserpens sp. TaxID=2020870 RepID=UPI00385D908A
MKTIKLLLGIVLSTVLFTSCYTETVVVEDPYVEPTITLAELLGSYELWYVNIHETTGSGEVPFLQRAFTVSFRGGTLYANNNIAGIGFNGSGFGIDVGFYDTNIDVVRIDHDIDGFYPLEVYQLTDRRIRLYDRNSNTSYFLTGYQRATFDYDFVFYDNIHYFLQEYEAWKKVFTSTAGEINAFDEENYMAFLPDGFGDTFLSSRDEVGTPIADLIWDYEGNYTIYDVEGDEYSKVLTLDYDYLDNEYFELSVIDDENIQLFHPSSGTTYEFSGSGYIAYLREGKGETKGKVAKKRKKIINKKFIKENFNK